MAAFASWDESYSVGIKSIDDQHKRLFQLLSDFYASLENQSMADASAKILAGLFDYTKVHFADEEKLMAQAGYWNLASHQKQHAIFVAKLAEVDARLKAGGTVLSLEITKFVKDWLIQHIKGTDKEYAPVLKGKGIV